MPAHGTPPPRPRCRAACRGRRGRGAGRWRTSRPGPRARRDRRSRSGGSWSRRPSGATSNWSQARPGRRISAARRSSRSGLVAVDAPEIERVADARAARDRAGRGAARRRPRARSMKPRSRHSALPQYQPVRPPIRRMGAKAASGGTGTVMARRVDQARAEAHAAVRRRLGGGGERVVPARRRDRQSSRDLRARDRRRSARRPDGEDVRRARSRAPRWRCAGSRPACGPRARRSA